MGTSPHMPSCSSRNYGVSSSFEEELKVRAVATWRWNGMQEMLKDACSPHFGVAP
jgi:hypothetical protein